MSWRLVKNHPSLLLHHHRERDVTHSVETLIWYVWNVSVVCIKCTTPSWSGDWAASSYLCVNTILEMNTVQGLTCSAVPALVSLQSLNTCMLGWETVKWQFCVVYVHQACDGLVTCQGSLCQWVLGQHNTLNKKCIRCLLRGPGSASARWRLEDACRPFYDCIAASFVCPVH